MKYIQFNVITINILPNVSIYNTNSSIISTVYILTKNNFI